MCPAAAFKEKDGTVSYCYQVRYCTTVPQTIKNSTTGSTVKHRGAIVPTVLVRVKKSYRYLLVGYLLGTPAVVPARVPGTVPVLYLIPGTPTTQKILVSTYCTTKSKGVT